MCPEQNGAFPAFSGAGELRELNGTALAFAGDAVYELLVRDYVIAACGGRTAELHRRTVSFSNAAFQCAAAKRLLPLLTPEEEAAFRRGRNARLTHVPKNKTQAEYHLATALEALFGYLYIIKDFARLQALFAEVAALNGELYNEETKKER